MKPTLTLALVSSLVLSFVGRAPAQSGGFFFPGYGNTYGLYSYGPGYNYGVNGTAVYGPSYNSLYNMMGPTRFSPRATTMYYPPAAAVPVAVNDRATIRVIVPTDDGKVMIGSTKTTSTGRERIFHTDPLEPGRYSYTVAATWTNQGQEITETRDVAVSPGQVSVVDFIRPK